MNMKKVFLTLIVFSLVIVVPSFSESQKYTSASKSSVTGKVQISADTNKYTWAEFSTRQGKDGLSATGSLHLWSEDNSRQTYVNLAYLNVDGEYAWFAGQCTNDNGSLTGRWLFVAVHDGGNPGRLADHIWWEWLPNSPDAEAVAKSKVENLEKPADNKSIKAGNIVVGVL